MTWRSQRGLTLAELSRKVRALIATRGAEGSEIHVDGQVLTIPVAPARKLVDPTGCGDAYRAGLLYGIANRLDWEVTGRLAAVMGSVKIEHSGGQNHAYDRVEVADRFAEAVGVLDFYHASQHLWVLAEALHRQDAFRRQGQDAPGIHQKRAPFLGQGHLALGTVQQAHADLLLEVMDLARERGLG